MGASLSYEPSFRVGNNFQVGSFRSVWDDRSLGYLLRIVPVLEFSEVLEGSPFITRPEGDQFFGAGVLAELALRPFGKNSPWEIKGSYSVMNDFGGSDGGTHDLWKAKATWWMTENVGFTAEYQRGTTPVAEKDIDLWTVGSELKF